MSKESSDHLCSLVRVKMTKKCAQMREVVTFEEVTLGKLISIIRPLENLMISLYFFG